MAAPSGTVWGNIVDNYGRLGLYVSKSTTNTESKISIQIWFWSKYSATDTNNDLYFNDNASSATTKVTSGKTDIRTTVNSGAWSTSNQQLIYTYPSFMISRGTGTQTRSCAAKLSGVEIVSGTMTVSATYTIPALDSYTISYNANGKTLTNSLPVSHEKSYGETVYVSTTVPTTNGYTCKGWVTAPPKYTFYKFGASYTANAGAVLYASWVANTYKVAYNANGGSGAPAEQTKTYDVTLALRTEEPTRVNYNFLGWSTSPTATTAEYDPGASYTANSEVTLYAVWELAYVPPIISNVVIERCDAEGNPTDDGTYFNVALDWATDDNFPAAGTYVHINVNGSDGSENTLPEFTIDGFNGQFSKTALGDGSLSTEYSYTITITLYDIHNSSSVQRSIMPMDYVIDILAKGKGISFGEPATQKNANGFANFKWPIATDYIYSRFAKTLNTETIYEETDNLVDFQTRGFWVNKDLSGATYSYTMTTAEKIPVIGGSTLCTAMSGLSTDVLGDRFLIRISEYDDDDVVLVNEYTYSSIASQTDVTRHALHANTTKIAIMLTTNNWQVSISPEQFMEMQPRIYVGFNSSITPDTIYPKHKVVVEGSEHIKNSPIIPIPEIIYGQFGLAGTSNAQFFEALLKWICATYKNVENGIFVGGAQPISAGLVIIHVYSTYEYTSDDDTDSRYRNGVNASGLPRYCTGTYVGLPHNNTGNPCSTLRFGTSNHVFNLVAAGLDAYPVNSIYISYSHDSPASLFGGTWQRIENRFLWSVDGSGTIGATGGLASVALDVSEMPRHQHNLVNYNTNGASSYTYTSSSARIGDSLIGWDSNLRTSYTGGGEPHENMPPYIQVSIWRRVA